jgi:hypothetical protein
LCASAWRARNVGYPQDDGFMNAMMTSPRVLGYVASEKSLCDELGVAARHCFTTNSVLMVSSNEAIEQIASVRATAPGLDVIADTRYWASHFATPAVPTETSNTLFGLDVWADSALQRSGARRVLAPTGFVRLGDGASLAAILTETSQASHPGLITVIATDADALAPKYLPGFVSALEQTPDRQFAFLFAHKAKPLASYARLNGLRALLARFPGSYILGVDVPAGTDAIAHGAGWVGIGASSSRRWPRRPGDKGGGPLAAGYLPGTFLRELLEMRSPVIYTDWYANSRSPMCGTCGRPLDSYRPTPSDKALIIEHNVHAIRDFVLEITAQPAADQAAWLNEQRVEALMRHTQLTSTAALVDADVTLRRLCELDDPQMRETSRTGAWL